MDAEKCAFLFGTGTAPADVEDREGWPARLSALRGLGEEGTDRFRSTFDEVVAVQIADDEPPEVWATAQRLLAAGLDRNAVMSNLCLTLLSEMHRALASEDGYDRADYVAALARLPLPSPEEVRRVACRLVAAQPGIGSDDLEAVVAAHFGLQAGHEPEASLFDRVFDDLANDGTWAMLTPDRLVDVAGLSERIVLTHRINEGEHAVRALTVSLDLAGFSHLAGPLRTPEGAELDPFSVAHGHCAWKVPDGWLDAYPIGTLVAVRVSAGVVSIEVIDEADVVDDHGLVAALRAAYDREVADADLPVDVADLLWSLLIDDPARFDVPRVPLRETCTAAGLEPSAGRVAHDPALWDNQRQLERMHATFHHLDTSEQRLAALAVLDLLEGRADIEDATEVGAAVAGLADPEVLVAVGSILFADDDGADPWRAGEVLAELSGGRWRKPVLARLEWLAALAAERRRAPLEALAHLEAAVAADATLAPAIDRLAWYRSDQGDAAAAERLWRRLAPDAEVDLDLRIVSRFARPAGAAGEKRGRNAPCWCGSGRKFKACHLGRRDLVALPDRVPWLCRKAGAYVERRGGDVVHDIYSLAQLRAGEAGDAAMARALADPLVVDVVLCELGWFERFVAERGPLLPDDEALLAASWMLVERTVYEVESVTPGVGLALRDLRTGDVLDVRERAFSTHAEAHQLVCGRAVPDGSTHQLVGGLFVVTPGTERDLLEILDEGDGYELMAFVGASERPPRLATREGEPLRRCRATIAVDDPAAARSVLDDAYERDGADRWIELHDLDPSGEDRIVRATITLAGGEVVVEAMSDERLDRVLTMIESALPSARVVSDERHSIDTSAWGTGGGGEEDDELGAGTAPSAELAAAMEAIRERFEDRWCDEPVPALAGLTPRQAAADVTRREEVVRLLASFPEPPEGPPATSGGPLMRPSRLRALLGLDG